MAKRRSAGIYLARNTLILGALELAESFGVPRGDIVSEIGLEPTLLRGFGGLVPSEALVDAVECAALKTGRSDFGMLLGSRQDHRLVGPLGLLVEQASSVGEAIAFHKRFIHLHNAALEGTLIRRRSGVVYTLVSLAKGIFEPRHHVESVFVTVVRFVRMYLGPKWHPSSVQFKHERLADRSVYDRHFGPNVRFGQAVSGIAFTTAELARHITPREPEVKRRLRSMLHDLETYRNKDAPARVADLIRVLLPLGQCTVEAVARAMDLTPRTLQRKLDARKLSFKAVVADTRFAMAEEYLKGGAFTMTQLAPVLGFSEASALSRFLRNHSNLSGRDLRKSAR